MISRSVSRWFSSHRADLGLATLAAAFGWASLTYPFGRDQGLYYYVGREWALRGAIPYRDLFDHKTPGLYFVHAVCVLVFGETFWGIRFADLLAVLATGWVAGAIVAKARRIPKVPLRGFGALVASVLFFGFLDFKATSEGEIWMAVLVLGSLAVTCPRRTVTGPTHWRLFGGGAFAAAAFLMKPLAVLLLPLVVVPIVWRTRRQPRTLLVQALAFFGGTAAVLGPVGLYFLAHGALRSAYELVVEANSLYARHGRLLKTWDDFVLHTKDFIEWYRPLSQWLSVLFGLALVGAVVRRNRKAFESHLLGLLLSLAGWAAVCVQGKFYQGHWGVMIAGMTIVAVAVVGDVAKLAPKRTAGWVIAVASVGLLLLFGTSGARAEEHLDVNRAAIRWVFGRGTRDEFTSHFHEFFAGGSVADNEACGSWLREHTTESDFVAVRGFQPQVYASARRRYPGRLFWTVFALGPAGATHREKWLEEDRIAIAANPPKFVATFAFARGTIDGMDWWIPRGYTVRKVIGDFTIVEHTPETATQPW